MCGIAGVASIDGSKILFETIYDALVAMRERGTEHGAGFALYNPAPAGYVRAKIFVRRGIDEVLVEKLLSPITVEKLGQVSLSSSVYLDTRLLQDYPSAKAFTLLRFAQSSRFLDVYKSIGWPEEVAKVYRLWGRASRAWIGHTRYPTNSPGFQPWLAHPFSSYETVIVHNGDLSSYGANKRLIMHELGLKGFTGNDSEVIAHLITILVRDNYNVEEAIEALIHGKGPRWAKLDGPFAVIFIYGTHRGPIFGAFVDKHHFRPLYAGVTEDHVYVASEAAAIKKMNPRVKPRLLRGGGYIVLYPDGELVINGLASEKNYTYPEPPSNAIDASDLSYTELNKRIREELEVKGYAAVVNVQGHRYVANGMGPGRLEIWGTLGNASLNLVRGMTIHVYGDAQEDLADCAENSLIVVHGDVGDAVAQAMRSGEVHVAGNAGNRAGVQMKGGYLVIGGDAGDYLGEFMAGGLILVLGRVGKYTATGMVGGKIIVATRVPLHHVGIAPPRRQIERLLASLEKHQLISREQLIKALQAQTVDELKEALGDAFKHLERLWGSLHLGYPRVEYRYLSDDEAEIVKELLERHARLTGKKIDAEDMLTKKYTIITRARLH